MKILIVEDDKKVALKKGVKLVQKAPALPKKAVGVFSKGLGAVKPREVKEVEARITA